MSLKLRGGVWHFRKMINGHIISRSTKTSDPKLAAQIAAKFEHEAVKEIVFTGNKPITLHAAIEGFLKARKGTGGYTNACVHMKHWQALPDVPMKELKLFQVQEVVQRGGDGFDQVCCFDGRRHGSDNGYEGACLHYPRRCRAGFCRFGGT